MAYSEDTENIEYNLNNIQEVLRDQLEQLSEKCSKPIYVLPAIDDNVESQFEQELRNESKYITEKRIILIPYLLANSHWIGILIEFQTSKQIIRAEYIDPVYGSNFIPDRLQRQLDKVYSSVVLQTKDLLKNNDRKHSAELTIKNLLTAIENDQRSDDIHQDKRQPYGNILDGNELSTYSTESKSMHSLQNDSTIRTPTTSMPTEGNDYNLVELEQQLKDGPEKLNIQFEEGGRRDDAEKAKNYLYNLQKLQKISKIIDPKSVSSISSRDDEPNRNRTDRQDRIGSSNAVTLEKNKKLLHLNELREDSATMPFCAEKTIMILLEHFEQKLLEDNRYSQSKIQ
ncbi:unnamed protein product [Didymodactylos carnosus]|uniref:Uncharacterized protein n=1 Tax=Didymodactylos carnosus TaxID=1234261 RepID=A0A8S2IMB4_9BILA|nr:unnamed protein product [Didymodactylos carnosus]CAF3763625.1 unnamed protein product [Didymodactylos carnosus]